MDNNTLSHHGIKGMKWGVRRTPAQLGHKTSSKKKRKTSPNAIERVKKALARHKQASEAKKSKAKVEEEQNQQKSKEEILKRGSAAEVLSLKGKISNAELQAAVNRLNLERQLSDMNSRDLNAGKDKLSTTMDKVDKLNQNAKKGIDAYNTVAKVVNSLTDNDLPVIDGVNKKEQKAEKAKKKKEEAERKEIEKITKSGNLEEIKKNINRLDKSDIEYLNKRFKFETSLDEYMNNKTSDANIDKGKKAVDDLFDDAEDED